MYSGSSLSLSLLFLLLPLSLLPKLNLSLLFPLPFLSLLPDFFSSPSLLIDGSSTTSTAGTPDTGHTAVAIEDWTGIGGAPLKVLQSNVGGSPLTRKGEYNLGDLVSGEVRAFRVMDEEWGGGPARSEL